MSRPLVKFIGKTTLFFSGVVLCSMLLLHLSVQYRPHNFKSQGMDFPIWSEQMERISTKSEIRNAIIGDSRGNAGVDPLKLGGSWQNLSLPGASLIEAYLVYHRHITSGNRLDTLMLMFSVEQMDHEPRWFTRNAITFHLIDPQELGCLEAKEREQSWYHGYGKTGSMAELYLRQLRRRLRYVNFPLNFLDNFDKGVKDLLYRKEATDSTRNAILYSLRTTRGHLRFGTADVDSTVGLKADDTFSLTYLNRYYLERLLTEAGSAGTKVLFFVAPNNESTCKVFRGSPHEASMKSILESFESQHPNLRVETDLMCLPDSCFGDNAHLNLRGVDTYQPILRQHINTLR